MVNVFLAAIIYMYGYYPPTPMSHDFKFCEMSLTIKDIIHLVEFKDGDILTLTEWRRRQQLDLKNMIREIQNDTEVIRVKCLAITQKITLQTPGLVTATLPHHKEKQKTHSVGTF